jgi:hypothetical protein
MEKIEEYNQSEFSLSTQIDEKLPEKDYRKNMSLDNNNNVIEEIENKSDDPIQANKGECIIPWAIADTFVWSAAAVTCGICSVM